MKDTHGGRVLVVEDDPGLAEGIRENLRLEGYDTQLATDGRSALDVALRQDLDLIVLDVMLPALDGFEVCSKLRRAGRDVPVLFLSARSEANDRIRGLEAGGDDYLPKPFHLKELLLRVAAIIRRHRASGAEDGTDEGRFEFAENEIDLRKCRGRSWDGREHELTQREVMILKTLLEREGRIVSREEMLERVWGHDVFPSSRILETFIGRLRRRFEREAGRPAHFHTEPGLGWRFTRHPEAH